jgi:hypothetical protein
MVPGEAPLERVVAVCMAAGLVVVQSRSPSGIGTMHHPYGAWGNNEKGSFHRRFNVSRAVEPSICRERVW